MKPQVIGSAVRVSKAYESVLDAVRVRRHVQTPRRLRVITFRGLGTCSALRVRGRVVRQVFTTNGANGNGRYTTRTHFLSICRAFDVDDVAGVTVRVAAAGMHACGTTDEGGYFDVELPCPERLEPGWHQVTVRCQTNAETSTATGDVFVVDNNARLLIVSDLDDTAMDTETLRHWRMLRTVLFRSAERRQPIPGVPALYRALHEGRDGTRNPVCYISSGAWNLYDAIVQYLDIHRMPRGAVQLNDWGSRQRQFHTVVHEHKSVHVTALFRRFPTLPLLLIGDDTQVDPEIYSQAALSHPGRVAAIWIRAVNPDPARSECVRALQRELHEEGISLVYSRNTALFEQNAVERGWITAP